MLEGHCAEPTERELWLLHPTSEASIADDRDGNGPWRRPNQQAGSTEKSLYAQGRGRRLREPVTGGEQVQVVGEGMKEWELPSLSRPSTAMW